MIPETCRSPFFRPGCRILEKIMDYKCLLPKKANGKLNRLFETWYTQHFVTANIYEVG